MPARVNLADECHVMQTRVSMGRTAPRLGKPYHRAGRKPVERKRDTKSNRPSTSGNRYAHHCEANGAIVPLRVLLERRQSSRKDSNIKPADKRNIPIAARNRQRGADVFTDCLVFQWSYLKSSTTTRPHNLAHTGHTRVCSDHTFHQMFFSIAFEIFSLARCRSFPAPALSIPTKA